VDGVSSAPLILCDAVRRDLAKLRARAARSPVDIARWTEAIKTPSGRELHLKQMDAQTVVIPGPWPFSVTLSIDVGNPIGPCRHMSMSVRRLGRVPTPPAVEMVARELGFVGGVLDYHRVWTERMRDGGKAVHIVQVIASHPEAGQSRPH
jgi:hypothetical protein